MELSDLKVFRTVVQAGGVTRAAELLHRVQSNVTMRVKKLEDELGVALFVREGRRMQLSPAGATLLEYADRLLALAEEARSAMRDARPRGVLRLGAMESTAAVRLPPAFKRLQARYPELAVELHTGDPRQLAAQVLAGELDAALIAEPAVDNRLQRLSVYDEELVLIAPAGQSPIRTPRDIAQPTLLAFHPGCPHRSRLEEWFTRARVMPERIVELGSYHAILGCAAAGMGVALMPRSVLEGFAERGGLSVHPMKGRYHTVRTLLVWRREARQPKIGALIEALEVRKTAGPRRGAKADSR
jgi:DNA-binding transcriptional LysR family regulator